MRIIGILCVTLILTTGCTQQDRESLGKVGRRIFQEMEDTTGTSPNPLASGLQAVRGSVSDSNLDSRVVLRLRWERELEGTCIRARVIGPATVQLEGLLKEESQRGRAIEIAKTTCGVEQVEDKMQVK